jgi:hypothetical protein
MSVWSVPGSYSLRLSIGEKAGTKEPFRNNLANRSLTVAARKRVGAVTVRERLAEIGQVIS